MIRERVEAYWTRWLDRRIRRTPQLKLSQKSIFIFPSRAGLGFFVLLLLLLLLAINYQNNLVFGLAFWLFSMYLVAIFHTYANLSGIELQAGSVQPVYAGDRASFNLLVRAGGRVRHALYIGWPREGGETVWIAADEERRLSLPCTAARRGLFQPPRLLLESHYPLGWLRCWTWVALDWRCVVYPQPLWVGELPPSLGDKPDEHQLSEPWGDDFAGFHRYQPGDSLRRAYWRAYAKEQPLMIMEYSQSREREVWLDWEQLGGRDTETRLSALCAWALDCEQREVPYGLRLPGQEMAPGRGEEHLSRMLRELALYQP